MRVLLRNKARGNFFQGVEDWTLELEEAFDFQSPERAVKFVRNANLKAAEMEIVLAFDNPRYNIPLPVDERFGVVPVATDLRSARADAPRSAPPSVPPAPCVRDAGNVTGAFTS